MNLLGMMRRGSRNFTVIVALRIVEYFGISMWTFVDSFVTIIVITRLIIKVLESSLREQSEHGKAFGRIMRKDRV